MAAAGDIPGAVRSAGGHWVIPDTPGVRKWARAMRKLQTDRRRSERPLRRKAAYAKLDGSIVAALRLLEIMPDDETSEQARTTIAATGRQLIDLASDTSARIRRGGAWRDAEDAVEALNHWWWHHGASASRNERERFAGLLSEVVALSCRVDG